LLLRGNVGEPVIGTVTIFPDPKYPFKILEIKPKTGGDIRVIMEEKTDSGTRKNSYVLTVENLKKEPGRYYDIIEVKTDSPVKPEFQISVYGQIMDLQKKTQ
jgi:hypothetical protein